MSSYLTKETWPFTLIMSLIWLQTALVLGVCLEMIKGQGSFFAIIMFLIVGLWVAIAFFAQILYLNQKARRKYPTTVFAVLLLSLVPTISIVVAPFFITDNSSLGGAIAAVLVPLFLAVPILIILIAFHRSNGKPNKTKQR